MVPGQVSTVLAACSNVIAEKRPELPSPAQGNKPPVVRNILIGTTLQGQLVLLNYVLKR